MKIDFSRVMIKDIEGRDIAADVSRELGNLLYLGGQDVAVCDLGRQIYHEHEVDLNARQAQIVRNIIEQRLTYVIKKSLLPLLDAVIVGRDE